MPENRNSLDAYAYTQYALAYTLSIPSRSPEDLKLTIFGSAPKHVVGTLEKKPTIPHW